MSKKPLREYVHELVEPVVIQLGYELVEVEYKNQGGPWKMTVFIYKPEGVAFEDCELVSRTIDPILDEDEFVCGKYDFLQVSSPGLDRPIKTLKDYRRYVDSNLEISLYFPLDGEKKLVGKLVSVMEDSIEIDIKTKVTKIEIKQIAKANLAIKF